MSIRYLHSRSLRRNKYPRDPRS